MVKDPTWLAAHELADAYREEALDPVDVVSHQFRRLEKLEPSLNAFVFTRFEAAMDEARESRARWIQGAPRSPLEGVPVSVKDIVLMAGHPTGSGSATTDPDQAWDEDAPAVARLREAGAVILGKTTTSEFGWKGITDNPATGISRNPWDTSRSPGGSSGGAGASVAAGITPLAFGNDGGGSIRIPASYCGLFGLKPTFGRVPHYPNLSPFVTLAAGGPLARDVEDAAAMLNELAKPDPRDWHALPYDGTDWGDFLGREVEGLRIGYAPHLGGAEPTPGVKAIVDDAVAKLEDFGVIVEEAGEVVEPLRPTFEAYWKAGFAHIIRNIPHNKWGLLDPGFRALAEEGLEVDVETYQKAEVARMALGARFAEFHTRYDLLATPTMPSPAPPVDTVYHSDAFDRWRDATPYTVPFNYTGQPACSIPCGVTEAGLPVGLQLVAPKYGEGALLSMAWHCQRAGWFGRPDERLLASLGDAAAA
jgi:aspartyl-tRNA(Asn)/glutamyl-tRNA(Gln) amidotransferase subunit A